MVTSVTGQCQQCGGTASIVPGQDHFQCDYCRSLVFVADNPLTVDGIRPDGTSLDGAECPVCVKPLEAGKLDDQRVLFCSRCYGLLLRDSHFGSVVRQRRARRKSCEAERVKPIDQQQYQRRINCPSCLLKMDVHPYYGPGNVVIDSCVRCAYVWLDHSELRSIERAEGGKEPSIVPLHVNDAGEVTIIPPPAATVVSRTRSATRVATENSGLEDFLEAIFGF